MYRVLIAVSCLALGAAAISDQARAESTETTASKAQLAQQLQVDPADYTISELVQMKCIMDGDGSRQDKLRQIQAIKGYGRAPESATITEKAQLAGALGVDPAEYSLPQLALLKSMMEDDQCSVSDPAEFVKAGEQLTEPAASVKSQLAQSLGVDPTEYTLSELVKMKFD